MLKKYLVLSPSDFGLAVTGCLFAVSSMTFAAIMIGKEINQPLFNGIDHLMLFAQPVRSTPLESRMSAEKSVIDFQQTGATDASIRTQPHLFRTQPSGETSSPEPGRPYQLKSVSDGAVYIDNGYEKILAKEGVMVPGQGRILLIEKRAGHWIVVTTQGILLENAS